MVICISCGGGVREPFTVGYLKAGHSNLLKSCKQCFLWLSEWMCNYRNISFSFSCPAECNYRLGKMVYESNTHTSQAIDRPTVRGGGGKFVQLIY